MKAGAAHVDITPPLGRKIQGAYVDQVAEFTRDPLEANALYLENDGREILLISCDLAVLHIEQVAEYCAAIEAGTGIDRNAVIIHCTHTHSGPSVWKNTLKDIDEEYLLCLGNKLVTVAGEAVRRKVSAHIAWNSGSAQIGYNRRICYEDGRHEMHGNAHAKACTGMEGPDDPSQTAIFLRDMAGKLIAIFHSNTSHPTAFYGKNFWSADFPGESRKHLRNIFSDIPVLFFTGSEGDIANRSQYSTTKETHDCICARCAHLVTGETLKLLHEATWRDNAVLDLRSEELSLGVRMPTEERLQWARNTLARVNAGENVILKEAAIAYRINRLPEVFGNSPVIHLPIKGVRIGEVGLFVQPSEFYCQLGLDIKRRSPAEHTVVASCCNGGVGYCPTTYAIYTGGYSGEARIWACLEEMAGYKIVDAACRMLHDLWHTHTEQPEPK